MPEFRHTDTVRWESTTVPGQHRVPVRIYHPDSKNYGWLVWAHGGSWRAGSAADWHQACAALALAASCTLVSVDYRLAPRHRHPAALADVIAALEWAQTQAACENPHTPVAVGGDSAGGTLAACAALAWRDQQRPLAAQVLAYPPLDPQCQAPSYTRTPDSFPTRAWMIAAWQDYLAQIPPGTASGLYSTPLHAEDLTGMAPAILAVGKLDPVSDDVRLYARRLRADGNHVELRVFPELQHGAFLHPNNSDATSGQPQASPLHRWLGTTLRHHLLAITSHR
ncbi:alpha/beta hydrolase [Streptomyces sp. RB6PN25]|uniref:Alpha/beta hydrolase n=1 Tax=Streptomyces humicola TaxID=2953240 RepID=A0ABT1PT70_9ACTN|nr:alpha/beta hydrolase [Streptomyces humicola]MCQ4079747.1 alpha/beta hydrolase [Streptomyces humicola]